MTLRVLGASVAYFIVVFGAGFLLGTLRTFLIAPQVGELAAVIGQVPVMLVVAWFACGWVLSMAQPPQSALGMILVGAVALGLLLIAEAAVSVTLAGIPLSEHFRSYSQPAALVGLAAQLLYACFPLIRASGNFASSPEFGVERKRIRESTECALPPFR